MAIFVADTIVSTRAAIELMATSLFSPVKCLIFSFGPMTSANGSFSFFHRKS